jgi:hypothetical protein
MRSPKQVFLNHLKQMRELNRRTTPTPQDVEQRVQELVRDTLFGAQGMWPVQADEQTLRQMRMLIDRGLGKMVTDHFIYSGVCDTLQVVDGQLIISINIVPLRSAEWITLECKVLAQGVEFQDQ